ncbi:thyrotropin-releasing hormone-degrading ectoenzyme-like [Pseudomyrmex gracilis]|uniref:thyrotropin-releasing hormone-degrading ectoenzyme-like n=1 Tax=Pseudomyrmex gracilis TaxID=219809 RepID=UPI000995A0B8|nr:thyrotropin-releasing hormone-degrading ectoenzyme-like [Pseudomyrmex gracilis]
MQKVKIVMLFLQLFISNILIVLVDGNYNYREFTFKEHITPLYYKLDIELPNHIRQNIAINGESRITIRIEENIEHLGFLSFAFVQDVTLHKINPYNVTIREPYVREHLIATYKPKKHQLKDSLVVLVFNKAIECGYYVLEIIFSTEVTNSAETDGFILTSYKNLKGELQWMVATQTRVRGPQALFPCWDNPRLKTVFDVSIRHRTNYMVFTNSKIHNFELEKSNVRMWTHFESTPPIPAHCIDIIVLPKTSYFTYVYLDNVTMWIPDISDLSPEFDFAWNITKEVTKYLMEQNLLDQCKVTQTNYIALENLSHEILVNPSFILYRKENIQIHSVSWYYSLYLISPKEQKEMNVALLIAQKITYQWILRSTNPSYWLFSRVKDGSNFLAMCILQKVLPEFKVAFWQIKSQYEYFYEISLIEYSYITSFIIDENDVMRFIISTRTELCESNEESFFN